ncbi:MAG: fused MFS/spermidine synthase [Steroidobacteraceae bacterium]
MKTHRKRTLVAFDSPWTYDPGTVRIFEPDDGASREEASWRVRNGEHKTPFMLETASERQLLFTRSSLQSTMLIDEPYALICAYTQKMMSFLLFNPDPRHIVMIGLGGGSLAKFCYRNLRNTRFTAVEIDADVIALRDEFFLPADNERFRVVHADGARFMSRLEQRVDVILVDAFDADGVAVSLATSTFYEDAASRLDSDGVLVLNLSGDRSRYPAHLRRLRKAFGDRLLMLPVAASDNVLVFAFKTELPEPADTDFAICAQQLESQLQLEFPRYLQKLCQGRDLTELQEY